jgi:outer membrane protein
MKQFVLPLNILLALAVAVLYFLHFSGGKKPVVQAAAGKSDSTVAAAPARIAYVDLDSIQEKYEYYKEKMADFEKKKDNADRDLNSAFQKIENERVAFIQKGQSITQVEAENFQREYTRKMQNLENQKRNLENTIQNEGVKTMEELKKKINEFLEEYNKSRGYSYIFSYSSNINMLFYKDTALNITNEVILGLNDAYNKSKVKK